METDWKPFGHLLKTNMISINSGHMQGPNKSTFARLLKAYPGARHLHPQVTRDPLCIENPNLGEKT